MITSKTSFLALIGNPVTHSLSPIIQNTALQFLGLDLIYIAIPCESQDLALVINSLKKVNCKGLNITIPYKQKVFNICNKVSHIAEKLKEVNIPDIKKGQLKILQLNIGYMCNKTCSHCHVDAGPNRQEMMSMKVLKRCLSLMT